MDSLSLYIKSAHNTKLACRQFLQKLLTHRGRSLALPLAGLVVFGVLLAALRPHARPLTESDHGFKRDRGTERDWTRRQVRIQTSPLSFP